MRIKFLAPPLSLAFLFFGLSYVDAAELVLRRPPATPQVEVFSSDRPYYIAYRLGSGKAALPQKVLSET